MKKIAGSNFNLQVSDGETISVQISNTIKIVNQVIYVFNGSDPVLSTSQPYTRTLHKTGTDADPDPSVLSARVTFSDASGGHFRISVSGKAGEDTSVYDYDQAGSQASEQLNYILSFS